MGILRRDQVLDPGVLIVMQCDASQAQRSTPELDQGRTGRLRRGRPRGRLGIGSRLDAYLEIDSRTELDRREMVDPRALDPDSDMLHLGSHPGREEGP